jgi:lysophospholipase L1-like esterase
MSSNPGSEPFRVVFFGDSVCVGQGVSLYHGWVTRTARLLDELSAQAGREIVVINASINGNTTRQALERMPYDVQSHGVDVMIVQFGLNDCNHWLSDRGLPRVSPEAFSANLEEIVRRGRLFGARTVFLNSNHPTSRTREVLPHTSITYEESNRRYNAIVRELAGRLGGLVTFNDVEAEFRRAIDAGRACEEFLLSDGLHLSRAGHELYYGFLSQRIHEAAARLVGQA